MINSKHIKPLKKTNTFQLNKSSSMDFSVPDETITNYVPKKSPNTVEFPTSPQLIFGEEMIHFSHPKHPLSKVDLPDLFTCFGCKEFGAGKRFTCQQCDFQLHEFCASAPSTLKGHPFHCQHQLVLYFKPLKGGIGLSKCDVCSKPVKGYNFRCKACSFQMHPCCAKLSSEMKFPDYHPHTLRLLPTGSAAIQSGGNNSYLCGECRRKRSGRLYHCTVCDYHLHAVCAKNMINGLNENGKKGIEKPSGFGTVAKLAGHVVSDFIGGIFEGLGQSVGEVLLDNATRGGGPSNNTARPTWN